MGDVGLRMSLSFERVESIRTHQFDLQKWWEKEAEEHWGEL